MAASKCNAKSRRRFVIRPRSYFNIRVNTLSRGYPQVAESLTIWQITALLLQIICSFAGGVVAYVLLNWAMTRFQLGLEYRLSDLEGRVNREVKIRASEASRGKKGTDQELLDQIKAETVPQGSGMPTLFDWTRSKYGTLQKDQKNG